MFRTKRESVQSSNKNTTETTEKIISSNPLDTYIVNSRWKTSVKADGFKIDSNFCAVILGHAHKLDAKTQTATAGFIVCMHTKGWKAKKSLINNHS